MKTGNDTTGIATKSSKNVLSIDGRAIEEEEFKKKAKLNIFKTIK